MPLVVCPGCGEDEGLTGERHLAEDGAEQLRLRCGRCGTSWDRDGRARCGLCGSDDVEGIPTATLQEHGRGEQWAPSGVRLVYYCWACRASDVTSSQPLPGPQPPPGGDHDVRALRRRAT